ncbi:MAG: arsenate reductase (glutaredoxin) [Deltaproteobacteria bacterium]|nr:arsenate reductase (glutaredoxin) [Deltaproteobacteria bacterium]
MSRTVTLWHNPRCSKSRGALGLLQERGVEVRERRYLDEPPTAAELHALFAALGLEPWQVCRLGEDEAKEAGMADWPRESADRQTWIAAMVAHPKLLERPIAVVGDRAVVGRPPEQVLELLA